MTKKITSKLRMLLIPLGLVATLSYCIFSNCKIEKKERIKIRIERKGKKEQVFRA